MSEGAQPGLGLADVLGDAAEGVEGISRSDAAGGTSWSTGGVVFATVSGQGAEFRLDPVVASAARRTPDTAASSRGDDWVAFRPGELDEHAIDRAEAWFESAHRRAVRGAR